MINCLYPTCPHTSLCKIKIQPNNILTRSKNSSKRSSEKKSNSVVPLKSDEDACFHKERNYK
jgi:hypothetical protein